jgi:hypothetical protein
MIVFRQTDWRYPCLWESADQPAGRWHGAGEGPAHYFADTPTGAWAEFVRHEEITDAGDLATVRRQMWAVEIGDEPAHDVEVRSRVTGGGRQSYPACQDEARRLRARGARRLRARSAALVPGGAAGAVVDQGPQPAPPKDGFTIVVFGAPAGLIGWVAADRSRPPDEVLPRVRHYRSR